MAVLWFDGNWKDEGNKKNQGNSPAYKLIKLQIKRKVIEYQAYWVDELELGDGGQSL